MTATGALAASSVVWGDSTVTLTENSAIAFAGDAGTPVPYLRGARRLIPVSAKARTASLRSGFCFLHMWSWFCG